MTRFFRIIKKKKNKRRLTALWLFLVVIELFCPVLGDEAVFAASQYAPPAATTISKNFSPKGSNLDRISVAFSLNQEQHPPQTCCNDDCLCHGMAMLSLPVSIEKSSFFRSERTTSSVRNSFFNSPSPPYPPPKIS